MQLRTGKCLGANSLVSFLHTRALTTRYGPTQCPPSKFFSIGTYWGHFPKKHRKFWLRLGIPDILNTFNYFYTDRKRANKVKPKCINIKSGSPYHIPLQWITYIVTLSGWSAMTSFHVQRKLLSVKRWMMNKKLPSNTIIKWWLPFLGLHTSIMLHRPPRINPPNIISGLM